MSGCLGCWIDCDSELVSRTFPIKCAVKISNAEAQYLCEMILAAITCPKTLAGLSFGGHSERGKFRIKSEKVFCRALPHVGEETNPKPKAMAVSLRCYRFLLHFCICGDSSKHPNPSIVATTSNWEQGHIIHWLWTSLSYLEISRYPDI